jgi:hypothetical protein
MRGADLVVTTRTAVDLRRVFLGHDLSSVTLLNAGYDGLPRRVADRLKAMAVTNPSLFEPDRIAAGFVDGELRVDASGVFLGSTRLADTDRVIERIPRDELRLVKRAGGEVHASRTAVIAGAVLGAVVSVPTFLSTVDCRISESVTGCKLQLYAPIWMPFAGGAIGYAVSRRVDEEIYYRRD